MRPNSLWFRLIVSSLVIATILLVSTALLLNAVFVRALQHNFDLRLRSAMDGLLANIELAPDGHPQLQSALPDSQYTLPLSGWYWQISEPGGLLPDTKSASLLEQALSPPPADAVPEKDGVVAYSVKDAGGTNLRVIAQDVTLFASPKPYAIRVSGNFDELRGEIYAFQRTLLASFGILCAALLAAVAFQARFSLQPLDNIRLQLNDIRTGKAEFLPENFPAEIQPVADELNLLVESNLEIVERSRMQVGNLAHALKTPMSILNNEVRDNKTSLGHTVREQVEVMRDQINLYLDRARRAARAQSIGAATEIAPIAEALARTLKRINAQRDLEIKVAISPDIRFRGEKQDLEEMLGNVMDNACKWAKQRVHVTASTDTGLESNARSWVYIEVGDDGPGIPEQKREAALIRGGRLDESKPGSGLGMSIIFETAAMYGGTLQLGQSNLGGLQATLKLPIAV